MMGKELQGEKGALSGARAWSREGGRADLGGQQVRSSSARSPCKVSTARFRPWGVGKLLRRLGQPPEEQGPAGHSLCSQVPGEPRKAGAGRPLRKAPAFLNTGVLNRRSQHTFPSSFILKYSSAPAGDVLSVCTSARPPTAQASGLEEPEPPAGPVPVLAGEAGYQPEVTSSPDFWMPCPLSGHSEGPLSDAMASPAWTAVCSGHLPPCGMMACGLSTLWTESKVIARMGAKYGVQAVACDLHHSLRGAPAPLLSRARAESSLWVSPGGVRLVQFLLIAFSPQAMVVRRELVCLKSLICLVQNLVV